MADRSDPQQSVDTGRLRVHDERIRTAVASNAAVMLVGSMFLFQYWRMGLMIVFWSLLAALAVVGLNVIFLYRTRRIKISGYVSASVLFLLLVVAVAASGGFYDPMFSWLYVVPLAAAFLVDLTALIVFLGLVLAATVVFWLLPPGLLPNMVPPEMYPLHSLLNRLATLVSLGMMTAFFVRGQYRAFRLLKESNEALHEEIEAHTRTTEALAESEAEFRDLVENSADMIWTHDLSGTILSTNEPFCRFLGLPAKDVLGRGGDRFLAPDSLATWEDYLLKVATEGGYRGVMRLIDAEGKAQTLEFHNTLRDDGVEAPLVRAVARDVSKQVASQAALQRRVDQEQLMVAVSTRFIDTAAEELATGIELALGEIGSFLECDRSSFFLYSGHAGTFERLCGWSKSPRSEGTGAGVSISIPWLQPRLEQFETIAVSRKSEDLPAEGRADLEALLGEEAQSATVVPVFGKEGLMGLLTLETVETERKWLHDHQTLAHIAGIVFGNAFARVREEQRTLRLQDEVQQARKMESLGLIAGGIAHDFNNLLMVVLGNASLAMSQVAEGSGAQEALQAIDSSARSAAKLTAQMLAYAGGAAMDRGEANVNALVELELEQARATPPAGIEIEQRLATDLKPAYADPALVRQMLRALLDNAFEAIGESGGVVEVSTKQVDFDPANPAVGYRPIRTGLAAGACAVIEVRDTGPGIELGSIEKIFDPFFSTKFAGRGLGLAAALGVVRGHEGLIEVETTAQGTCMRVLIPTVRARAEVRSLAPREDVGASVESGETARSVLVLDSNPEVLAVLDGLLTSGGYEPLGTHLPYEALERLEQNGSRIYAVVAELKCVEGHDALLAARWRTEDIPWILSSDERREDISERLAYAGASAFLSKPFEGRKLLSLLDGLLREYAAARPAR